MRRPKWAALGGKASSGYIETMTVSIISRMKGHEDGGYVLWKSRSSSANRSKQRFRDDP